MTRKRLPKYVSEFRDRHGKMRVRFRRKGQKDHYFQSIPWTPEFMMEYQACLDRTAAPAIQPGVNKTKPGTFDALIANYYGSHIFKSLRPSSRETYRGIIERFREKHGDKPVDLFARKHAMAILGAMDKTPSAANNLLDRLKVLMRFAVDIGMIHADPLVGMRGYPTKGEGFHTWTEDEIAAFEARHEIGSKARLALSLMLHTGQRRSDAIAMGWQHVNGHRISVVQRKTGARLEIPMHPTLQAVMAATPRENMTFLVTRHGKPFSSAGFGNWFRERCDEAGLTHCSAHGLRKAAARRLAEAGCSNQQIKAMTGHKTDRQVSGYTAAASQILLADQAMAATYGMDREQKLSTPDQGVATSAGNHLKEKGK